MYTRRRRGQKNSPEHPPTLSTSQNLPLKTPGYPRASCCALCLLWPSNDDKYAHKTQEDLFKYRIMEQVRSEDVTFGHD
jgi:hypothetical protein